MRIELEDEKKSEGKEPLPASKEQEETESLRDEIRLQQEKLRDMTFRQKLAYYVFYYKWQVIIAVVAIGFLVSLVHSLLVKRDEAFYCVFLNVDHAMADTTEFAEAFENFAEIDRKKYKSVFDSSITTTGDNPIFAEDAYDSVTRLNAMYMAAQVDVTCCDEEKIEEYIKEGGIMMDLKTLLDEAELERLDEKGLLVYSPEKVPVAVKIDGSQMLAMSGCYDAGRDLYACVMANSRHYGYFDEFIAFLGL